MRMSSWWGECGRIVHWVLGFGQIVSAKDEAILCSLGALTMLLLMLFAGHAAGIPNLGWLRRLIALAGGLAAMLAAEAATTLYVLPIVQQPALQFALRIAAPLIAGLFVAVPWVCFTLKSGYGQSLFSFSISLLAGALILMATNAVLQSVRGEVKEFGVIRERSRQFEGEMRR